MGQDILPKEQAAAYLEQCESIIEDSVTLMLENKGAFAPSGPPPPPSALVPRIACARARTRDVP